MAEPQKTQQTDPFEAAAQAYKASGAQSASPDGASGNDDWKVWQQDNAQDQAPPQTTLQKIGNGALDFAKGLGEGAVSTMSAGDDWARKHLPAFFTNSDLGFGKPANLEHVKELATPTDTMQKIGKGAEQTAEFLIPGDAEEAAAAKVAEYAPKAKTLAKIGASALGAGAVNKVQGGTFTGGAAAGAAGAALGAGLKKAAPVIFEKAIGTRAPDRGFARTIGEHGLAETKGYNAGNVAAEARDKVGQYTADLDRNAKDSEVPYDLQPARDEAGSWLSTAEKRNNKSTILDVGKIGQQLDTRGGELIPRFIRADEGLALRRGIDDLHKSYNPATLSDFTDRAVDATRGVMNDGLEEAIPNYRPLNSKISNLLPIAQRAGATDLNESMLARLLTRGAARTGVLAGGALGGGYAGYEKGGIPGAVAGGIAGFAAPELLTHPTTLLRIARTANSPAMRRLFIPAAEGSALNFFGRDKEQTK